ncbi:hypothetical protein PR048_030474 [Dryococelus australis]|uniref:Uncharacterized protein n=1 Tax=Dryococelus australis TaxID=614101 RepID=A0ABQ9GBX8_9NEOP|nr:hypothetical protein PR048_030474 [Dryococelus australis]
MMAIDYQPYSIVEDAGFKSLVEVLEPKHNIPSRTTFSRAIIPALCQEEKQKLSQEIESCAREFTFSHTALFCMTSLSNENVAAACRHCLRLNSYRQYQELQISIAENITWRKVQCFDDTLHIAVTDIKKEHNIDDPLAYGRAIVCHYCQSTVAGERLHKFQSQLKSLNMN